MPTIIHTADVHLGAPLGWLGGRAAEQREQLRKTFAGIVDLVIGENADCLLVAGDLFDSNRPPASAVRFVLRELARLTESCDAHAVLLPGSHDHAGEGSVYDCYASEFEEIDRVSIIGGSKGGIVRVPRARLRFMGSRRRPVARRTGRCPRSDRTRSATSTSRSYTAPSMLRRPLRMIIPSLARSSGLRVGRTSHLDTGIRGRRSTEGTRRLSILVHPRSWLRISSVRGTWRASRSGARARGSRRCALVRRSWLPRPWTWRAPRTRSRLLAVSAQRSPLRRTLLSRRRSRGFFRLIRRLTNAPCSMSWAVTISASSHRSTRTTCA
ncbi:metallophosphoesterase [bacterium]|nr:metallophosphoesterase [bacterium]